MNAKEIRAMERDAYLGTPLGTQLRRLGLPPVRHLVKTRARMERIGQHPELLRLINASQRERKEILAEHLETHGTKGDAHQFEQDVGAVLSTVQAILDGLDIQAS